jgi:hypothetical protein
MRVTITFGDQAEQECRGNEHRYSFLSRREAKPLPHFMEFETPPLFSHELFQQSATQSNFGFQPEMSCRLPSLRVPEAKMPVRRDRPDASVTGQRARRNIRTSNENLSQTSESFSCIQSCSL